MRTREARRPELALLSDPGKGQVGRLDYLGLPGVLQCKGATAMRRGAKGALGEAKLLPARHPLKL